ncbi:HAMP domain-containing protein [Lentibacter algarum]|uniref:ATP-binding protein n=1 Tax=Lentibacter algarum TaxID=576131 RepID=UPI001C0688F4|nr:ATP-binding protein [Lentibacter algarum]MBU2980507.1 HAMP domain-containing protein [Lentibacter algarum]
MPRRVTQKWRPPLALVIGGTLAAVLCLPLLGVGYFRLAGNVLGWGETSWLIGWMAVWATAVLGYLLWRLVLRPVYALTAHANAVKDGQHNAPLPPHFGTPEFSTLAHAVDDMATALQNREAGIRAYSDHVTHELKSPLTSITAAAELLEADMSEADRSELIGSIRTSSARMQELLNSLRKLATARVPYGRGPTQLSSALSGLSDSLEVRLQQDAELPIDQAALRVVLEQLARNASEHGATELLLHADPATLKVSDNGPGIAEGDRTRVFDPFFTTRRETGGTGMGLSIVKAMLEANNAEIVLLPSPQGTAFRVSF